MTGARPPVEDMGRLRWRCRRGMKELDRLLGAYLSEQFAAAPPAQQNAFRRLLDLPDPQLFAYCLGRETPPSADLAELIGRITRQAPVT